LGGGPTLNNINNNNNNYMFPVRRLGVHLDHLGMLLFNIGDVRFTCTHLINARNSALNLWISEGWKTQDMVRIDAEEGIVR
jgi:hypothetical protein